MKYKIEDTYLINYIKSFNLPKIKDCVLTKILCIFKLKQLIVPNVSYKENLNTIILERKYANTYSGGRILGIFNKITIRDKNGNILHDTSSVNLLRNSYNQRMNELSVIHRHNNSGLHGANIKNKPLDYYIRLHPDFVF